MFKKTEETIFETNEGINTVSHKIENSNKEIEIVKKNKWKFSSSKLE